MKKQSNESSLIKELEKKTEEVNILIRKLADLGVSTSITHHYQEKRDGNKPVIVYEYIYCKLYKDLEFKSKWPD